MNVFKVLLAGLVLSSSVALAEVPTKAPAAVPAEVAMPQFGPRTLSGTVHNVSVGLGGLVTFNVRQNKDVLTATGRFSGLFGLFETSGRLLDNCAKGHTCLFFSGIIRFDPQNGGWPAGTATTFTMTIDVQPGGSVGTGVYHVGSLPGYDHPQYGTMSLKSNK